jgi:hypothetical protein
MSTKHPVFRLADSEHVAGGFEPRSEGVVRLHPRDRDEDVDDRLRRQPRNSSRSNVLDRERDVANRRADPFSFGLETHWPARVVVADHDFHRLASANQNLIEVRVEPVGPLHDRHRSSGVARCRDVGQDPARLSPARAFERSAWALAFEVCRDRSGFVLTRWRE